MRANFLTRFNSSENWEENTVDDDDFFDFDDEFIDDVFYDDEEETFPSYDSYDSSPPYSYFDEYGEFNDQGSSIPYLEKYGTDLTLLAAEGKLNECFGRDAELLAVMEILVRRQKNNPVLIGDAGVGKTAIVELFATRLVRNLVPFVLIISQGHRFFGELADVFTILRHPFISIGLLITRVTAGSVQNPPELYLCHVRFFKNGSACFYMVD
jgi:hypothetical protein